MHRQLLCLIISCALFSGCTRIHSPQDSATLALAQLQGVGATAINNNSSVNAIRTATIQESAMSLGAQAGLAWQANQINTLLENEDRSLRQVFNFNSVILDKNVLPPVMVEANGSLNLASPDTIRLADQTYKILKQARFVTTAPNWREYLLMNYPTPGAPDRTVLPQNNNERKLWNYYLQQGWEQGITQANQIYQQNLASLKQDMQGMILYRKLLAERMISKPFVAKTELGITGGGDSDEMRVNDQVLRITALPKLNPRGKEWLPALSNQGAPTNQRFFEK